MFTRLATPEDALDVRRILDASMLEPGNVEARIEADDVFVAGDRWEASGDSNPSSAQTERVLGTIVLEPVGEAEDRKDGAHISAIGVRRRHRGKGIGRSLVERAIKRERRLTARFDADVYPFYESLEFSIEPIDDERYRGSLERPR
ncbi:GNAT family N-acetyltransferase [Halostagnicola sp. A-GB9-2]|uniref:GNAT family N-acetyltransferase n=1 Tax=Halostagnicola sp. A-GB9-2 TaxID=3048066 RepID=UPI0024BFE715|nr:GNAT family N-acetyltransferase [Halostagnicola sp. A-GB9-2]MDJ1432742.1 GNAT family N-acetyltransferase [Halostagnicola sp. A-GB9-2]